jgi:hypothetical protein
MNLISSLDRAPINDYIYLYDIQGNTYQQITISNTNQASGAGPRFCHNGQLLSHFHLHPFFSHLFFNIMI